MIFRSLGAAISITVLLAACSNSGLIELPFSETTDGTAGTEAYPSDWDGSKLRVDEETGPTIQPLAAPPRRKPAYYRAERPGRPLVVDPQRLVGLDYASIKELLGEPSLYDEDPPAKIWIYNVGVCILDVFFYPRIEDEEFRVLTYEINARRPNEQSSDSQIQAQTEEPQDGRRCLVAVVASRDSPEAR